MYRYKIIIVDDDRLLQNSLKNILAETYDVMIAGSGEKALQILKNQEADLILLDIRLPGIDGVDTLRKIRAMGNNTSVIMMTAYEDIKTVITSMKVGASDYLVKPLDIDELEIIIEKALENIKLKKEVEELRKQYIKEFDIDNIVAESEGIRDAFKLAHIFAKSDDTTVLLEGETGTGKEVVARTIHCRSSRFGKPFVCINCGAISKELIESELFGYEKGSFTGGLQEGKKGKIELAENGTLFLDEIGELLPASQVSLLRFLEEKEFYRVGGTATKKVNVRIIAATNKSLEEAIIKGTFRKDLYYRLNVAKIFLPPLRERQEDIIPLIMFFMTKFNDKFGKNFRSTSREARAILLQYPWTGNVRELRNFVERVVLVENDSEIQPEHILFLRHQIGNNFRHAQEQELKLPPTGLDLDELIKKLILQAIEMAHGNKAQAAKLLGMSRPTMIYRIEKYNIKV
ncbi:MAG: sigma-54 dependent transcriptional regulator [Syntrophales bacterium]|jgi:DNA-binding NtrC family response regulator|nr:sigma-54 dependent transcriptional regulator [Syntrophales bacterium]MCK9392993.1 sigma-54 dependent transcriptional regulator [Syntrophales bacterium]